MIQIPIQRRLSSGGYSDELLERLISTDLPYRKWPGYLRAAIAWMLFSIVREAGSDRAGAAEQ